MRSLRLSRHSLIFSDLLLISTVSTLSSSAASSFARQSFRHHSSCGFFPNRKDWTFGARNPFHLATTWSWRWRIEWVNLSSYSKLKSFFWRCRRNNSCALKNVEQMSLSPIFHWTFIFRILFFFTFSRGMAIISTTRSQRQSHSGRTMHFGARRITRQSSRKTVKQKSLSRLALPFGASRLIPTIYLFATDPQFSHLHVPIVGIGFCLFFVFCFLCFAFVRTPSMLSKGWAA